MLSAGATLGPYEVISPLGAGGMGEVYRARDTKLGRDVALKVLPEGALTDDEARRRFRKEADALARLAHPHIATIHDFGSANGTDFLVMELVRGPSLRDELEEKGALPEKTVVRLGTQLARGLQAAHEEGIVHRDLKPSNVQLTPDGLVKILDFGLAQLLPREAAGEETAPTETAIGKAAGTLLYMSPEQLRGRGVDSRTDLYAAGAVLYEMATGRPLFSRPSTAELTDSILNEEPRPPRELNDRISPGLEAVILKALDKDPELRHQTARDLLVDLERLHHRSRSSATVAPQTSGPSTTTRSHDPHSAGSTAAAPSETSSLTPVRTAPRALWQHPAAIALLVLAAALTAALVTWTLRPTPRELVQFTVEVPRKNGWRAGPGAALSPDGWSLAYVSPNEAGQDVIWIRPLDSLAARALEGTEGAYLPFWSPDGRSLGFFADRSLKRIAVTGGTAQTLADAPNAYGGSWSPNDVIVFSPNLRTPLHRVSAQGGETRQATVLDTEQGHGAHTSPSFLPDGKHFIFSVDAKEGYAGLYVGSLDSPEIRLVLPALSPGVVTDDGFLLFLEEGLVRARKLDTRRWEPKGPVVTVAEGAYQEEGAPNVYSGAMSLSVAANGTLAFRQGRANRRRLTWFDRTGASFGTVGAESSYESPVLSPDDDRVAFGRDGDIWIIDLSRGGAEYPLTSGPSREIYPIWSPDGRYVVYASGPEGSMVLHRKPANGTGEPESLRATGSPFSWSAGYITYFTTHPDTSDDIYVLPIDGDGEPKPFLRTEAIEHESSLSTDGKWMAYVTEGSGHLEVYVETFPRSGERWRISPAGGCQPIWRRDGRELFFLAIDGTLMAVPIQTSPQFEAGDPEPLFQTNGQVQTARNSYSPTRDGQRFLVNVDPEITVWKTAVVLNWREALADQ